MENIRSQRDRMKVFEGKEEVVWLLAVEETKQEQ